MPKQSFVATTQATLFAEEHLIPLSFVRKDTNLLQFGIELHDLLRDCFDGHVFMNGCHDEVVDFYVPDEDAYIYYTIHQV